MLKEWRPIRKNWWWRFVLVIIITACGGGGSSTDDNSGATGDTELIGPDGRTFIDAYSGVTVNDSVKFAGNFYNKCQLIYPH